MKEKYTTSGTGKNTTSQTRLARGGLRIFHIDTQLNYIKIKWIRSCWSHVVLKLILNSDQGLALFRQKQILTGLPATKIYESNEDFFI